VGCGAGIPPLGDARPPFRSCRHRGSRRGREGFKVGRTRSIRQSRSFCTPRCRPGSRPVLLAHQEHHHAVNVSPPWVHFDAGVGLQMILWGGRTRCPQGVRWPRVRGQPTVRQSAAQQIRSASFRVPGGCLHVSPHPGWAAVDRIGQEAQEASTMQRRRRGVVPICPSEVRRGRSERSRATDLLLTHSGRAEAGGGQRVATIQV